MRIDACPGCGAWIDIASDHMPDCPVTLKPKPIHNHRLRGLHGMDCPACRFYMDHGIWTPVPDPDYQHTEE